VGVFGCFFFLLSGGRPHQSWRARTPPPPRLKGNPRAFDKSYAGPTRETGWSVRIRSGFESACGVKTIKVQE